MKQTPLGTNNSTALATQLQKLWADNFLVYFKSHVFHFNVQGPGFVGDHAYFQEVYQTLWEAHDTLGELIRQLDKPVLTSLESLINASSVDEAEPVAKTAQDMYKEMSEELSELTESAQSLYEYADEHCYGGVSTVLGDYLKWLNKLNWKAKAAIGKSIK